MEKQTRLITSPFIRRTLSAMTTETVSIDANEAERLEALRSTNLLSSANDPVFDRLTQLAARLLDMPLASISLVDDSVVWLKSAVGFSTHRFPRSQTFCAHAVRRDKIMLDRKSTRLNSSHRPLSRMPSSA